MTKPSFVQRQVEKIVGSERKRKIEVSFPHSYVTEHAVHIWVFSCPDLRWGCETQFKGAWDLLLVMLFFLAWTF